MSNGDPKGQIFLSYPHTNNGFFFLLFTVFFFQNKLPEVPEYAKMQFHMMTLLDVLGKIHVAWVRYPRVKSQIFLSGMQEMSLYWAHHWQVILSYSTWWCKSGICTIYEKKATQNTIYQPPLILTEFRLHVDLINCTVIVTRSISRCTFRITSMALNRRKHW